MTFGEYVRQEREARGISLRKFAQRVGVSTAYISKVETGRMDPPGEMTIKRIANELEVDSDELLAKAGKISSDLIEIIIKNPRVLALIIRNHSLFRATWVSSGANPPL